MTVLTPPGTGAIATVAVVGPRAWDAVRSVFRPVKGSLPESPPPHRVYFGTLGAGGDEVVVGVRQGDPEPWVEVHCHGGRQVVRWVVSQLECGTRNGECGVEQAEAGDCAQDGQLGVEKLAAEVREMEARRGRLLELGESGETYEFSAGPVAMSGT